ncbi:hypothetical protein QR680_018034 [Steinernema hermaphroditum]|uniref:non-specific serine/threonine protein kinase n=1 Tax=Steinernema hermaphroditum TaxID=289476 RepID=A0AA39HGP3_9BILA|nr:hypothetical protein QR680_018034 [Steinernema hermaphroditum]
MPGTLLNNSEALMRTPEMKTPEMKFFHETWTTRREKMATQMGASAMPSTPVMDSIRRQRFLQQHGHFNVLSVGKTTEEVLAKSSSYRRTCKASFFEQCFVNKGSIGRGSFGEVLSVVSKDTGFPYAVKRQLKACDSNRLDALKEVNNFALLPDHPNLLRFVLAWEEQGLVYIQTELCAGNLDEYSRKYDLSELEVVFVLKDLLKPLGAIHQLGLIHFDIKPENILISFDGVCKLGDFGLLVDTRKGDLRIDMEGDNRYLDAAVFDGAGPSSASDIFSLGMTILELSTDLDLPRNGDRWIDLRHGVLPEEFIGRVSGELQTVIRSMLHSDPAQRPTAAQLLSAPLLEKLNHEKRPAFKPLPPLVSE